MDTQTNLVIKDTLITFKEDDGTVKSNITNEMGQIVIFGCANVVKTFQVENFCDTAAEITTQAGSNSQIVSLVKTTGNLSINIFI
jgi:hypothetical protein